MITPLHRFYISRYHAYRLKNTKKFPQLSIRTVYQNDLRHFHTEPGPYSQSLNQWDSGGVLVSETAPRDLMVHWLRTNVPLLLCFHLKRSSLFSGCYCFLEGRCLFVLVFSLLLPGISFSREFLSWSVPLAFLGNRKTPILWLKDRGLTF